jgi:predicted nucleotidyltransferase
MVAPRSEIADLIARYCTQLGEMGIRVERALLFGSYARGAERGERH